MIKFRSALKEVIKKRRPVPPNQTVRYMFSLAFLLVLVVSVASVVGSSKSTIVLETKQKQHLTNETFAIDVYAVANTPVNAVSLSIAYPEDKIEILGIDRGESVITLWTSDPRVENGAVILEGGTYRKGFVGKHLIATINAKARATGEVVITTKEANLLAGDGRGTKIDAKVGEDSVARVQIAESNGTLEGEAVVLLVSDVNADGKVTLEDISIFMVEWFKQNNRYDFNNDGLMTFKDFSILLANYFRSKN
ncbi:MAG: hypothetical protein ACK4SL_01830 [Candidatus Paceibacteria bacterium]